MNETANLVTCDPTELGSTNARPSYLKMPADHLLAAFGAGNATPGSGSAAALLGMLAAQMMRCVAQITADRSAVAGATEALTFILETASDCTKKLEGLFHRDTELFDDVVDIRRERDASAASDGKRLLARKANDKLEEACDCVFEIADVGLQLFAVALQTYHVGWKPVRGDTGVAISSAAACVRSCIFVVNVNLTTLAQRQYARLAEQRIGMIGRRFESLELQAQQILSDFAGEAKSAVTAAQLSLTVE